MANINLISARRAERVRLKRITQGLLFGLIGTAAAGAGVTAMLAGNLVHQQLEIARTEQRLEALRPILREIEAQEAERSRLQPKLQTLTQAQARTRRWYGIMDGLKRVVPQETWLTNLAVEKTGEDAQLVRLNGIAPNQTRVGETMYRLSRQQEYYSKVDLRFTNARSGERIPHVEFELAAQLVPPAESAQGGEHATQTN